MAAEEEEWCLLDLNFFPSFRGCDEPAAAAIAACVAVECPPPGDAAAAASAAAQPAAPGLQFVTLRARAELAAPVAAWLYGEWGHLSDDPENCAEKLRRSLVGAGLGHIVALYDRSSTLYYIC